MSGTGNGANGTAQPAADSDGFIPCAGQENKQVSKKSTDFMELWQLNKASLLNFLMTKGITMPGTAQKTEIIH
jgi:hypothetical protein